MIHASDISKTYGRVRALDRTSFELPAGQVAGLLGPNGAGKTTTIRILTGTTPPDSGDVSIAGASITRDPMLARRKMGYLPEHNPLYPEMTPEAYLHHRGRLFGLDRKARVAAIEREVSRCEIGAMRTRRISALSKGYRQRVGLAAALLHDPEVLILDEPTNGLDPTQVHQARLLITELAEKRTVLLCSHILPEVERLCDRVMVLVAGQVRADGTPAELARDHAGAPTYRIEIRTNPSADPGLAPRLLSTVHGVAHIEPAPNQPVDARVGWQSLIITAHDDAADLREPLAGACADAGYFIREINRERVGLEALFMRLIEDRGALA
ncbi:MAG: ABC-2 type transport system ATP-binding protein [Phycisphaerales bacterium]|jgi:ABC-2 type transport system ATP-binding protein